MQLDSPRESYRTTRAKSALVMITTNSSNLLAELQQADSSVLCIPHTAMNRIGHNTELLDDPEVVRAEYYFLKTYFPELYVHNRETYMYSQILMCFNEPLDYVIEKARYSFRVEDHGVYKRLLQIEDYAMVDSFIYSHRDIPVDRLCIFLSKMCGYHISDQWKAANIGKRGPNTAPICSMHLECDVSNKRPVASFLEALYNKKHRK
jgi:hypothetical protein